MAFVGIELYADKDSNDSGSLAIVHPLWLTPRKQEVLWPPVKTQHNYDKLLKKGEIPNENWETYKIKRVLFTTGKSKPVRA